MATLWVKSQPVISAYINASVVDFHKAEDLLQETARVVAERFDDYDPDRPFVAWAIGIAKNLILKSYRQHANDRHIFSSETMEHIASAFDRIQPELTPLREALRMCIDHVQGKSRQVLELRYIREMKPANIAERMGMNTNNVHVILHRIRKALSHCIQERLESEGGRR